MQEEWVSSCVPYRTEEEDGGRRKGGEAGGAGGVEEEMSARRGWLGFTSGGTEGKSLRHSSFLFTHLSASAFSSAVFTPHLDSLYPFFPFSTLFLLPVQALYVLLSFILFFHSFHSSLSLLCTFFPLLPLSCCSILSQKKSLA